MPLPTSPTQPVTPEQIWQTALGELQLQLTSATFNTWLGRTRLVAFEDGTFVVGVHNAYAQDWLEHRLAAMVKRTLHDVAGQAVEVRFVVCERELPPAPVPAIPIIGTALIDPPTREEIATRDERLPDMAPDDLGWYPISTYASRFWRPLLGRVAWAVYEIVRESDKRPPKLRTEWTPPRAWTAPALAEDVPCGRQALTGTLRAGKPQPGAFDRLAALEVGRVQRQGREPHIVYEISVRVMLPWLLPEQIEQLSEQLRVKHRRWMEKRGL